MSQRPEPDWDPAAAHVLRDQRAAYDTMRESCPVAYSELLQWSLFRHADVTRVLEDHATFSSTASKHLSVPSGMDPPEHTQYRRIVDKYLGEERVEQFEAACRRIVGELLQDMLQKQQVELMADFAFPFAVRVQGAFLSWPAELQQPLVRWTQRSHTATLAQDRPALSALAREFEGYVDGLLDSRRSDGALPDDDLMAGLMHEQVWGRPLSNEEIASILRNWTAGEVGTISASVGILAHFLATQQQLQQQLREQPSVVGEAIEEILRLDGPLAANRRVTTREVELGGRRIGAGERLSLMWIAANRDPAAFDDADQFRWGRNHSKNLLWGAGIHICPGAPLARLELRLYIEELLARSTRIELANDAAVTRATYPASGFSELHLRIQ